MGKGFGGGGGRPNRAEVYAVSEVVIFVMTCPNDQLFSAWVP